MNKKEELKYNNRVAIVDTETTGLTYRDELIEITVLLAKFDPQGNLSLLDEYTGLREPEVRIKPGAQQVHGIDIDTIRNKSINHEKLKSIFASTQLVVAHNAKFDKRFVKKEMRCVTRKRWLCSMENINWGKRGFRSRSLANLLIHHNISNENAHRSKGDAIALMKLLNCKEGANTTYFWRILQNNNVRAVNVDF